MADENVKIGICSWTDRTLLSSGFYPRSAATPAARLAFYAAQFDVVEVDSTFYALADSARAFKWLAGTPKGFRFGVKSYALFTFHKAKYGSLPHWLRGELGDREPAAFVRRDDLTHEQRVRLFEEFVKPVRMIHHAGRLAYLLFQFPPHWRFGREGLVYFKRLREICGPMPLAVEVRSDTWLRRGNREKLIRMLESQNIAYVAVDEPALPWTVKPDWPITAEWGTLARFHGRNAAGWRNPKASVHERFDYEYAPGELAEWLPRVEAAKSAVRAAGNLYLMYNNCVADKAIKGARTMKGLLGMEDVLPPEGRQRSLGL